MSMNTLERDLCDAIACAIGDLAAIERAAGGGDPLGPLRDVRVRAQMAQRDLIRALGSVPMSGAPAEAMPRAAWVWPKPRTAHDCLPGEGTLDLATLARNAGAA